MGAPPPPSSSSHHPYQQGRTAGSSSDPPLNQGLGEVIPVDSVVGPCRWWNHRVQVPQDLSPNDNATRDADHHKEMQFTLLPKLMTPKLDKIEYNL
ncbi:hypothetical protein Tco_1504244 [Tanacetum coccineum]